MYKFLSNVIKVYCISRETKCILKRVCSLYVYYCSLTVPFSIPRMIKISLQKNLPSFVFIVSRAQASFARLNAQKTRESEIT